MAYSKDTILYEHFQYHPLQHNELQVTKQLKEHPVTKDLESAGLVDNSTFVGIEVEVERMNDNGLSPKLISELNPVWMIKLDGSLRNNGREFVSLPIRGKNVISALHLLHAHLNTHHKKHEFSERTSIHIHVNVRKLSIEQVICFLFVYISVEKSIFKFIKSSGWDRSNNIFCVPLAESDMYVGLMFLIKYLKEDKINDIILVLRQMWKKYTAFNTLPVAEKGTFELRHMGGTIDVNVITNWVNLILCMKKYAEKTPLEKMIQIITDLNVNSQYEAYLQEIFGEYYYLVGGDTINSELEEGVCVVKDILGWATEIKEYPATIPEIETSGLYKYLNKEFGFEFVKTDFMELKKESTKLTARLHELSGLLSPGNGLEPNDRENFIKEFRRIEQRLNMIEDMLGMNPPRKFKKGMPIPEEMDMDMAEPVQDEPEDDNDEEHQ